MPAPLPVLGIDFGTSNSAIGIVQDGQPKLIAVEGDASTLPTALFVDFDSRRVIYGQAAQRALIDGLEGRYMRGLKSLLGTALMREPRRLLNERLDFIEITGRFLAHLKARAEAAEGRVFEIAISGRPVRFHDKDDAKEMQAEADLREAYARAGFKEVRFLPEPEAAARAYGSELAPGTLALVVDIGGGTSDYTVFRAGDPGIEVLASHGIRLGGTDFDRTLSIAHVMPLLGRGSQIRHTFGSDTHLAPNKIFNDLATWAKIPFLYGPETRRAAADLARHAVSPQRLGRLVSVLEDEVGHDMAFAVEAGKIETNTRGDSEIRLDMVEPGLRQPLPVVAMAETLADHATRIGEAAVVASKAAGLAPEDLDALVLVGGSSLMGVVAEALAQRFPGKPLLRGAALTAVADGLALASGDPV